MLPQLGRYETLSKIASGGMATVYLGRVVGEGGFERLVALKLMHPHIANDPDFVGMFLDEARLAARIRHPNVVSTIDIQKTENSLFIVMDYVDGPTLQEMRKHLKSKGEQLPIGIAVRIILDILNGLHEAHELLGDDGRPLNLVHRDVSPHNVLIGTDGVAQLTDFGVAKAEARISSTRGGQLKGKIAYMPPEQILTEPVTRRADLYSAAVCLWEAVVGKRLFRAPNDGAMVHMILEGQVDPPSVYVDDVDPGIESVILKALSRRADDRFADAIEFADALEDATRAAGIKIPRGREVGRFIKAIKSELGEARHSARSLTPPSSPSTRAAAPGTNRAHRGSPGAGPSIPSPAQSAPSAQPAPPAVAGPGGTRPDIATPYIPTAEEQGPPPIPDIGLPQPRPSRPRAQAPTPPPDVPRFGGNMSDMVHSSSPTSPSHPTSPTSPTSPSHPTSPTSPTSPTQTEAVFTPMPTSSRSGVVAVVVAGVFALVVIIAVTMGDPKGDEDDIPIPAAPSPRPTQTVEPDTPETALPPKPTTAPTAEPSSSAEPPDEGGDDEETGDDGAEDEAEEDEAPPKRPYIPRRRRPRPTPKPTSTVFRPQEL